MDDILENITKNILNNAKYLLNRYFTEYNMINPVIVFDIDDTLFVSNSIPNKPVIDFYNYIKNVVNIPVYIITARAETEANVIATSQLLKSHDILFDKIFFRQPDDYDVFKFKNNAREYIVRNLQKTIVMSIGDMVWDVNTYCHIPVLLPNRNNLNNFVVC